MDPISPFPPQPVRKPVMLQRWQSLTFLHWPFLPGTIASLLPRQVTLDTFDDRAWVGLTPFLLADLRPPLLPAFPWLSQFPETNVRTYVRGPDGKRGVWFFTLEADRLLAVLGARLLYHLPYRWAKMRVEGGARTVHYRSNRNRAFGEGHTDIVIEWGEPMQLGQFDHFLTARYRLYTVAGNRLAYADIEHEPWPLRHARVLTLDQDLLVHSGVPQPSGEPTVHFSQDLVVKIGPVRWTK